MIPSMELQKVGPDLVTEQQNWAETDCTGRNFHQPEGQSELKGNCYKSKHIVGGQHLLHQRKRKKITML